MNRLYIDEYVQRLADKYKNICCTNTSKSHFHPVKNLESLANWIKNDTYVAVATNVKGRVEILPRDKKVYILYIREIINSFDKLLVAHPKELIASKSLFEKILDNSELAVKFERRKDIECNAISTPYKSASLFYELLVWALQYKYVQGKIFPEIVRQLGIKTCVYCNTQYAVTTHRNEALYQLDHCWPKSKYPYLCISFFNLQPCCGSCNIRKSADDIMIGSYNVNIWKELADKSEEYFRFHLDESSLAIYLIKHKTEKLKIDLAVDKKSPKDLIDFRNKYNRIFRIESQYAEHRDVVEEVIWKKYVYCQSYADSLKAAFRDSFGDLEHEFSRLLMGTYCSANDMYKRPLAKLIQDIANQLHMVIVEEKD